MRPLHWLFVVFIALPLAEILVLIELGGWLGSIVTIALVVFTAVLGAMLMQQQGLSAVQRLRLTSARGQVPAMELLEGGAILVGGLLLLTPGFITDALGFLCLIRPARRWLILRCARRAFHKDYGRPGRRQAGGGRDQGPVTLEGEYRRVDEPDRDR